MARYKGLISFEHLEYGTPRYKDLLQHDVYSKKHLDAAAGVLGVGMAGASKAGFLSPSPLSSPFYTYMPLELMMLELRYVQRPYQWYNSIPCYRPDMCANDHTNVSFRTEAAGGKAGVEYVFPPRYAPPQRRRYKQASNPFVYHAR
eukprot:CAMPEP_0173231340 /NCGR_PEP_ID=MMETSP1142-20121109/8330_1 /TAXON_ID=483371 /ORGANISM="non described non described, Strain CCMP2298" /LENGTH=145 /DNA_ID=CAMNT_0014160687 /DNA_START=521 /DNA_END=958 /DNA_ORIENTATION=+